MEFFNKYLNKLIEFGNYLISINNDDSKKVFINDILIKCNLHNCLITIKLMRNEDSQLDEFIDVYGLEDNNENREKLKEYLDLFLSYQEYINI